MAIRIFITGGTFDKEYNEITGQLFFNDTHMNDLLGLGRSKVPVEIRTLMMVDSLEMTDEDRELIAYQCNQCDETQIVITHGTDTMSETAKVLAQKVKNKTESMIAFEDITVMSRANSLAFYELLGNAELINQELSNYNAVTAENIRSYSKQIFDPANSSVLYYYSNN